MFYTAKRIVKEKASVNSEASKKRRLQYAKGMREMLRNEKYFVVFQDEMPFYFTVGRNYGYAKKGERAVMKTPPVSNMSFRTQVSMAVSPSAGLLHGKAYLPEKSSGFHKKTGVPTKECWKTSWSRDKFLEFMKELLAELFKERDHLELSGKRIVIVVDGAPDHFGKQKFPKILKETDACKVLDAFVKTGDAQASVEVLFAPPNSPQLNLCEYYNRTLRICANAARHQPEFADKLLGDYNHGEKMEGRVNAMRSILSTQLDLLKKNPLQHRSVICMENFFKEVIDQNGYLDWHKRML